MSIEKVIGEIPDTQDLPAPGLLSTACDADTSNRYRGAAYKMSPSNRFRDQHRCSSITPARHRTIISARIRLIDYLSPMDLRGPWAPRRYMYQHRDGLGTASYSLY